MEQVPSPRDRPIPSAPAPAPAPPLEVPTELPTVAEETKSHEETPSAPVQHTRGEMGTSEAARGHGRQIGQEHWRRKEVRTTAWQQQSTT